MFTVEITKLNLKLLEERNLLSDVNFTLEKNKIYTIVGKNGSGKTTLLKALTGLLDKRFYSLEGKIAYNGKNILTMNSKDIIDLRRDKIKYVFQDAVNSFDHLRKMGYYFKKITKDFSEADDLLKYFLLPDSGKLFKLYPYELSGGMAQRVSFVLALLAHPQIIFLDEPTSGVDSAIANLFLLKLKEFAQQNDNLVLLVTHDLTFAEKCSDLMASLSKGSLSVFVSPDEFIENEIYRVPQI